MRVNTSTDAKMNLSTRSTSAAISTLINYAHLADQSVGMLIVSGFPAQKSSLVDPTFRRDDWEI